MYASAAAGDVHGPRPSAEASWRRWAGASADARAGSAGARPDSKHTISYSAWSSSGATAAYQSPAASSPGANTDRGDALSWMRELYLQLTRYTWSIRRSAGIGSTPGGRCGPFHSTTADGRPRRPPGDARKQRPLAHAAANSAR